LTLDLATPSTPDSVGSALSDLVPALERLDRRIEWAIAAAAASLAGEDPGDPYRGLTIGPAEVQRLLARSPGAPAFAPAPPRIDGDDDPANTAGCLARLAEAFDLSEFDLDVVLLCLAPELDLRYERLFAYLQDDVTKRRPSVDLALNLLCATAADRVERRVHFDARAPLIGHGLIEILPEPGSVQPPLLARFLKLDDRIIRHLLGQPGIDDRLAPFCTLAESSGSWWDLSFDPEVKRVLPALLADSRSRRRPMRLYFEGPRQSGKRSAAAALAGTAARPLLLADFNRLGEAKESFDRVLPLLLREALLLDAFLYLTGLPALRPDERAVPERALLAALADYPGTVVLAGAETWVPTANAALAVTSVPFRIPDFPERCACWVSSLGRHGFALGDADLEELAARFRLTPGQIGEAVELALQTGRWRTALAATDDADDGGSGEPPRLSLDDLYAAARAQCGHDLAKLARKIPVRASFADIVLPEDHLAQLREMCEQAQYRRTVYDEWGFERKLSGGKGLNVLFTGPPGTGKTMAAEVIAHSLGLDLYRIDLSQIVSKYIGETEKNLDRIFRAAENSNAILFFDEADALFGKRSEVRDSHDRYANIEIAYLLQKMEDYAGISILATNLRQNLDDAFVRRLQGIIEFPFPDEEHRRGIWERSFPPETPVGDDVAFDVLAREVPLPGGCIRNMAVAAAFYAAAETNPVGMTHLARAARREFQKLGRTWSGAMGAVPAP
jgi:hypothetical protein